MRSHLTGLVLLAVAATLLVTGCHTRSRGDVVATTTMLADLAQEIGGPELRVVSLLPPGADPHLYTPTPADAWAISGARLVVVSGLGLEGWVDDLVGHAGGSATVVVASEGVDALRALEGAAGADPHFWLDMSAWSTAATNVERALVAMTDDPQRRAEIEARGAAYRERVARADAWAKSRLETIPEGHRLVISSHDAFRYFGRRYGVQTAGLQGVTTETEASQRDVAERIDQVRASGVPAVFIETSVNPSLVQRVAQEAGVTLAGPLYSDSLGLPGTPAGTMVGMFAENVRIIVTALGGVWEELPQ
ncbi:MAG: zinc ABC transporter substrate-binding protein [Myxococcales bacterium]|nr:zinc ABC transporter substrate-binding protein [Myxococcales bacterium]